MGVTPSTRASQLFRLVGSTLLVTACHPVSVVESRPVATETTPDAAEPTRYDDLLRYVPARMESVLVFDLSEPVWPKEITECYAGTVRRGVLAGRKFLFPSGSGRDVGDFEGIVLLEADGDSTEALAPGPEAEYAFSYATFDVRRVPGQGPFFTRLTPTQVLYATTEQMMLEALSREGPGGRRLAADMGWPTGVPWESPLVLLRRPDPGLPAEETGDDRQAVLWLRNDQRIDPEASPVRFRVTSLLLHASDPRNLEFEARVRCADLIGADQIPEHPCLWETWGGLDLDDVTASMQTDYVLLRGNRRSFFAIEPAGVATLLVFGMLGVKVSI